MKAREKEREGESSYLVGAETEGAEAEAIEADFIRVRFVGCGECECEEGSGEEGGEHCGGVSGEWCGFGVEGGEGAVLNLLRMCGKNCGSGNSLTFEGLGEERRFGWRSCGRKGGSWCGRPGVS